MPKNKWAPDVSWEDVAYYCYEHAQSTGHEAVILIVPFRGVGGATYCEVELRPVNSPRSTPPTVVTRGEYPPKAVARQARCVLHVVAQAFEELERNPWLWSPERRAEARGERKGEPA